MSEQGCDWQRKKATGCSPRRKNCKEARVFMVSSCSYVAAEGGPLFFMLTNSCATVHACASDGAPLSAAHATH